VLQLVLEYRNLDQAFDAFLPEQLHDRPEHYDQVLLEFGQEWVAHKDECHVVQACQD
jgi:hypothetical protein